jgi:hypothetical protein
MPLETPSTFLQTPRSAARARRRLRNRRIGTAAGAEFVLAVLFTAGVLLARDPRGIEGDVGRVLP